jgi:hypothetical protein
MSQQAKPLMIRVNDTTDIACSSLFVCRKKKSFLIISSIRSVAPILTPRETVWVEAKEAR